MYNVKTKQSLAEQKKKISSQTKRLGNDLMTAKNDYFIVLTLDKLISILSTEIDSWYEMLSESTDSNELEEQQLLISASQHVESLSSLRDTFRNSRISLIDNALKIQLAMLNSHLISSPMIISEPQ
jgi:hypothetical protein